MESIVSDYPRTQTSAEAYYLLGKIYLSEAWDLDLAKEKFNQVKKEYSRSEYGPFCNSKVIAIDKYKDALTSLKQYEVKPDTLASDSLVSDSLRVKGVNALPPYEELLYLLGDIESFSFYRVDSGIVFFEKILETSGKFLELFRKCIEVFKNFLECSSEFLEISRTFLGI